MVDPIKDCTEINLHNPSLVPTIQCTLQCMGHAQKCITGTQIFPLSKLCSWKHTTVFHKSSKTNQHQVLKHLRPVVPNHFLVAILFRFPKNVGDSPIFFLNKRNKELHKMYLEKNIGQKCERNTTNITKELIIYMITEVASALPVLKFLVLFVSKPI